MQPISHVRPSLTHSLTRNSPCIRMIALLPSHSDLASSLLALHLASLPFQCSCYYHSALPHRTTPHHRTILVFFSSAATYLLRSGVPRPRPRLVVEATRAASLSISLALSRCRHSFCTFTCKYICTRHYTKQIRSTLVQKRADAPSDGRRGLYLTGFWSSLH